MTRGLGEEWGSREGFAVGRFVEGKIVGGRENETWCKKAMRMEGRTYLSENKGQILP